MLKIHFNTDNWLACWILDHLLVSIVVVLAASQDTSAYLQSQILPGCKSESSRAQEHVYVVGGGQTRYHMRSPGTCLDNCGGDPHAPTPCPDGYYEKEFRYGCQNCTGGCPECGSDWSDCVLQDVFPNTCRYTYAGSMGSHSGSSQEKGVPNRRPYKIRHCEKCHPSCTECSGPSATECTMCPTNGYYWGINKQCRKIGWKFTHGKVYQCYAADHCYLTHPDQVFHDPGSCSAHQTRLFEDEMFCAECTDRYCGGDCASSNSSAHCAFRDFGDGYHCSGKFHYLGVYARACIDMGNSCTSNPCPEDYQCRSTLDWQGFACDCNKTVSGRSCPPLIRPHPLQPPVPDIGRYGSGSDILTDSVSSDAVTSSSPPPPRYTTPVPLVPVSEAVRQLGSSNSCLVGLGVACALIALVAILIIVLLARRLHQLSTNQKATSTVARFLRHSALESTSSEISLQSKYGEMTEEYGTAVSQSCA